MAINKIKNNILIIKWKYIRNKNLPIGQRRDTANSICNKSVQEPFERKQNRIERSK